MPKINTHNDVNVYQLSFEAGMEVFNITKLFPKEKKFSLIDQIRRSSRSVFGNIAEVFRKRKYPKHVVSKLSDSEDEAAETQVWLDYAKECCYIKENTYSLIYDKYDHIIRMLVNMSINNEKWKI